MNNKDQLRFQSLLDDSVLARSLEAEELIKFCRELKNENGSLIKEIHHLKNNKNGLWKTIIDQIQELGQPGALLAPFVMVGILLTAAMSSLWVYSVIYSESTNRYYLSKQQETDTCIRIVEDINWGGDIEASECYSTVEAALPILIKLQEATHVTNKTKEEERANETTSSSSMGSSDSLVPTLWCYDGQEEGRGQEHLQAESE